MARVGYAKKVSDMGSGTVTFTFATKPETVRRAELAKYAPSIQRHFALHGISQKHGDNYGASKDVVSPVDAVAQFDELEKQLTAGKWTERVEGVARITLFAMAVQRHLASDRKRSDGKPIPPRKLSLDQVKDLIEKMDETKRNALKKHATVKAIIAKIRAEKADQAAKDATPIEDLI